MMCTRPCQQIDFIFTAKNTPHWRRSSGLLKESEKIATLTHTHTPLVLVRQPSIKDTISFGWHFIEDTIEAISINYGFPFTRMHACLNNCWWSKRPTHSHTCWSVSECVIIAENLNGRSYVCALMIIDRRRGTWASRRAVNWWLFSLRVCAGAPHLRQHRVESVHRHSGSAIIQYMLWQWNCTLAHSNQRNSSGQFGATGIIFVGFGLIGVNT